MGKGGRPHLATPETCAKIVALVQAGNYIETAAAAAGVVKSTVYSWLKRGAREKRRVAKSPRCKIRKRELPFVEFSNAVERAQGESESADVMLIAKASEKHWQAAAWRLERKFSKRWGRKDSLAHTGGGKKDTPIKVQHEHGLTDDQADLIKRKVFGMNDEPDDETETSDTNE